MMHIKLTSWLLTALLLCTAGQAIAEAPAEDDLNWDCWIEDDNVNPTSISCIHDRGDSAQVPDSQTAGNLEELLLDHIHYRLHNNDTSELGTLIRDNIKVFRRGAIWSIDIHLLPFDSSWDEGRPQLLVRTLLCPGHLPCRVNILRPSPQAPPAAPAPGKPRKKRR